jgi:translation initiation factor eIF-2B subunit epsilon
MLALDADTNECLHYSVISASHPIKQLELEVEKIGKRHTLEWRNDFIDCNVYVCSLEVPALFTENFDYQDMRKHFIHGVLTSDLLGKTIYCSVLENAYACRIKNFRLYDTVTHVFLSCQ